MKEIPYTPGPMLIKRMLFLELRKFYTRKNNNKVDSIETGRIVIEASSKVFHKSNCAIKITAFKASQNRKSSVAANIAAKSHSHSHI